MKQFKRYQPGWNTNLEYNLAVQAYCKLIVPEYRH